jgi:uncharacterized membrane protein YdjX (TVP38/TMEM64 family)
LGSGQKAVSAHSTLNRFCGGRNPPDSIMKKFLDQQILYILLCLFFPIAWGIFVNAIFTLVRNRRAKPESDQIQYHI